MKIRIDTTERTAAESFLLQLKYGDSGVPGIKMGKDKKTFSAGDVVTTSGKGILKAGLKFTIKECWFDNGYIRYSVEENSTTFYANDFEN